jgi:hypothetical protein
MAAGAQAGLQAVCHPPSREGRRPDIALAAPPPRPASSRADPGGRAAKRRGELPGRGAGKGLLSDVLDGGQGSAELSLFIDIELIDRPRGQPRLRLLRGPHQRTGENRRLAVIAQLPVCRDEAAACSPHVIEER